MSNPPGRISTDRATTIRDDLQGSETEPGATVFALASDLIDERSELERLRSLICDVAACGVENETRGYAVVQVDWPTWEACRKVKEGRP